VVPKKSNFNPVHQIEMGGQSLKKAGKKIAGKKPKPTIAEQILAHRTGATDRLPIEWASVIHPRKASLVPSNMPGRENELPHIDPNSQKRVVAELYPRLLYTFSDVVCFITNYPKLVLSILFSDDLAS